MTRYAWVLLSAVVLLGTTLTTYTQPTAIQTQQATATSASSASLTLAQAPTTGDLLLCSAAHSAGSGASITFPAGFTALGSQTNAGTSVGIQQAYHIVAGGDGSTYGITLSGTVGSVSWGCVEYAYVSTSSPIMSQQCTSSTSPSATETTPAQTPTEPTIGSSFFAAAGGTSTTTLNNSFTNYDGSVGTLLVHDQHSAPIYNFQQAFSASLSYAATPTAVAACTDLLTPIVTPFTVSIVSPRSTPTPTPTPAPTATPTPAGSAITHVMTAEYTGMVPALATAAPAPLAPYLTFAYPKGDHAGVTQAAGIKVIIYTNPLMPGSGNPQEWPLANGAYLHSMSTSCTGAMTKTYGGTRYLANVLGSYSNGSYTVNNAGSYIGAVMAAWQSYEVSGNPGYADPVNYFFVDNGDDYGATPTACGDTSQTVWAQGIASTMTAAGSIPHPIIINSLGVWTMPWAQAQQNALNSSNIAGGEFEGCYASNHWNSTITGDYISGTDKDWYEAEYAEINTIAKSKLFFCYSKNVGTGSSLIANRIYAYASFLLSYHPSYAVYQMADATSPSGLRVFPESRLVPLNPTVTASDVSGYLTSTGLYARQFAHCYYVGTLIGACGVYVNPSPTNTYAIPVNSYTKSAVLSGGGVLDGGTMTFNGPLPTSLGPTSAAILF